MMTHCIWNIGSMDFYDNPTASDVVFYMRLVIACEMGSMKFMSYSTAEGVKFYDMTHCM